MKPAQCGIIIPPLQQIKLPVHQRASGRMTMPKTPATSSSFPGRSWPCGSPGTLPNGVFWNQGFRIARNEGGFVNALGCNVSERQHLLIQYSYMSVSMGPTLSEFTVQRDLSSLAQVRVIESRAALVPPYIADGCKISDSEQ